MYSNQEWPCSCCAHIYIYILSIFPFRSLVALTLAVTFFFGPMFIFYPLTGSTCVGHIDSVCFQRPSETHSALFDTLIVHRQKHFTCPRVKELTLSFRLRCLKRTIPVSHAKTTGGTKG